MELVHILQAIFRDDSRFQRDRARGGQSGGFVRVYFHRVSPYLIAGSWNRHLIKASGFFDVGSFQAANDRHAQLHLGSRLHDAGREDVALHDAAEDVD